MAASQSLEAYMKLLSGMMAKYAEAREVRTPLSWVLPEILALLRCGAGSVFLLNSQTGRLECIHAVGPVQFTGMTIASDTGIAGHCFTSDMAVITQDASADSRHARHFDQDSGFQTEAMMTAPLSSGGRRFGVLQVLNRIPSCPEGRDEAGSHRFTEAELALLSLAGQLTAQALTMMEMNEKALSDQILQRDLAQAQEVQALLLSPGRMPDIISARSQPAQLIGGDFFDIVADAEHICFCFGDVSGKGISAGLIMASAVSLFRVAAEARMPAHRIIMQLNDYLMGLSADRFVVFTLVEYHILSGRCRIFPCGHSEIAIISSASEGDVAWYDALMPPLGVLAFSAPDISCYDLRLSPQQMLVCLSDGVTEARADQVNWGRAELTELLAALSEAKSPEFLVEKLFSLFTSERLSSHDDITALCLKPEG